MSSHTPHKMDPYENTHTTHMMNPYDNHIVSPYIAQTVSSQDSHITRGKQIMFTSE